MDAITAPTKPFRANRFLPYWAVFQADLRQTLGSWVYRAWVLLSVGAAVGCLVYRFGAYKGAGIMQPAAELMNDLLHYTVLGSITLIIILTGGSISAERGTLADSILCRGISRYQYFLGKWHARMMAVLGTFILIGMAVLVSSILLLSDEHLRWDGAAVALVTVAAMLAIVITGGVAISAMANNTLIAIAIVWMLLYGVGFGLSLLPSTYPSPDRTLKLLPAILHGNYDLQSMGRLVVGAAGVSLFVAIVGMVGFSRRDV